MRRYASPEAVLKRTTSKCSDEGSDSKMGEEDDGEDDSEEGFLSSSEEEDD